MLRSGTEQIILGSLRPLERGAGEHWSSLRGGGLRISETCARQGHEASSGCCCLGFPHSSRGGGWWLLNGQMDGWVTKKQPGPRHHTI